MQTITAAKNDSYHRVQTSNLRIWLTNTHVLNKKDSVKLEVDDNGEDFKLTVKCTNKKGDLSFARGAPGVVEGAMHGKIYDSYGYVTGELESDDSKTRGQGGNKGPWFDLNQVTELTGTYPCMLKDMPRTKVSQEITLPDNMNFIVDAYAHNKPGADDINDKIDPDETKILNIQAQMNFGCIHPDFDEETHSWGWSGGEFLTLAYLEDGNIYGVAYKNESDKFPFFSFCQCELDEAGVINRYIPTDEIDMLHVFQWTIDNFDKLESICEEKELDLMGLNKESLIKSAICGIHGLCEILGDVNGVAEGTVVINSEFDGELKMPVLVKEEEQEEEQEEESEMPELIIPLNSRRYIKGSKTFSTLLSLGKRGGILRHTNYDPQQELHGIAEGETIVRWSKSGKEAEATELLVKVVPVEE